MNKLSWTIILAFTLGWFCSTWFGLGSADASETVTIQGNTISIQNTLTDDEKEANLELYRKRGLKAEAQNMAEVKRKHEKEIELQKFANALMMQYAQAPKTSVTVLNNVQQKQKIKQTIEQSA